MKFNHRVKFKGILYEVGQNVPIEENKAENKANTKSQAVVKTDYVDEIVKDDAVVENNSYTKTEINRMSTAELKKLAKKNGLDESYSGAEIKKSLIELFGL